MNDISKPDISTFKPDADEIEERSVKVQAELNQAGKENSGSAWRRQSLIWRLALAFVAIPIVGVSAATATGLFSAEEMNISAGMGCYSEARIAASEIAVIGPTEDPIAACAEMWRAGEMRSDAGTAPPLVACTGQDEPVRVFPGNGSAVCEELGLTTLPADYPQAARQWSPPDG